MGMNIKAGEAAKPLSGRSGPLVKLLRSLSDDDLSEYCRYWAHRRNQYRGSAFVSWKCGILLAAGLRERGGRGVAV